MQDSRFTGEGERPADPQEAPSAPVVTIQATDDREGEDLRRDESIEEPGYGHGV